MKPFAPAAALLICLGTCAEAAGASRCPATHYGVGDGYGGRRMANGAIMRPYANTAAHRTLPFGTRVRVTYEEVIEFLASRKNVTGELEARLNHRRALLEQAVTKARRGYEPIALAEIGQFAQKYVAMLKAEKIDLEPGPGMIKQGPPGESRTMIFAPAALPKWPFLPQTRLVHQLREPSSVT